MKKFSKELTELLAILSSSAEIQLDYLKGMGNVSVDELALELHELMQIAPSMLEAGDVTQRRLNAVGLIDKKFNEMSGDKNAALWTESALCESADWAEIRILARKCFY